MKNKPDYSGIFVGTIMLLAPTIFFAMILLQTKTLVDEKTVVIVQKNIYHKERCYTYFRRACWGDGTWTQCADVEDWTCESAYYDTYVHVQSKFFNGPMYLRLNKSEGQDLTPGIELSYVYFFEINRFNHDTINQGLKSK